MSVETSTDCSQWLFKEKATKCQKIPQLKLNMNFVACSCKKVSPVCKAKSSIISATELQSRVKKLNLLIDKYITIVLCFIYNTGNPAINNKKLCCMYLTDANRNRLFNRSRNCESVKARISFQNMSAPVFVVPNSNAV